MTKRITTKQALMALEKATECLDRAWAADMRGMHNGSSMTGDRHRKTANNWQVKSEKNTDIVRAFILQEAGHPAAHDEAARDDAIRAILTEKDRRNA